MTRRKRLPTVLLCSGVLSLLVLKADEPPDNSHALHMQVSPPVQLRNPFAHQLQFGSAAPRQHKVIPPQPDRHLETGPFIDGAYTPEKIPDTVAYAQFFRMLRAGENTPESQKRQRSYIRHVLRSAERLPTDADVNAILRFVATYEQRLDDFDSRRAAESDEANLAKEIAATMRSHLAPELLASVDHYIRTRFKRTTKIIFPRAK
jgi:hypothetical protein